MCRVMEKPVCLINTDSEGCLYVVKEAKDILDGITQPVIVVAVVGLYRTGKSYLMNRLAGKQTGFVLGSTIESQTKGIWMWCVPHPKKTGHTLVLLDTEGLGDVDKGDEKHDTWIFCLAVLLSSTLVYNSSGVIDSNAIERLHYVTELNKTIKVKAHGGDHDNSTQFMQFFPSFIWAVRDFVLRLEKGGKRITADEYLESALKYKTGSGKEVEKFNLPRQCLRTFFAERRCFVFPRPAGDDNLARMEELSDSDLNERFLQCTMNFCNYVFNNSKPKTLTEGRVLIGSALGSLAEVYVEALRSGQVPCLENAVEALAQIQNERAVEQGLQVYKSQVAELLHFPLEPSELSDIHSKAEKAAIAVFLKNCFNDTEQKAQRKLKKVIDTAYQDLCDQNRQASLNACKQVLEQVFTPLHTAMRRGSFMHPGGYKEYCNELERLTNDFKARTHKQMMRDEVLNEFLKGKEEIGKNIYQADKCLTQAERSKEAERLRKVQLERRNESLRKNMERQKQALRDQQRSTEEHIKQLKKHMEEEIERQKTNNEQVMDAKLREQRVLLENGFNIRADEMNRELAYLRSINYSQEPICLIL